MRTKPHNYWNKVENITAEANQLRKLHKKRRFSGKFLKETGNVSLRNALERFRYHPLIQGIRARDSKLTTRKDAIKAIDHIKKHLRLKETPSLSYLKQLGYTNVVSMFRDRKKLPNGSLRDEQYILGEAARLMSENNWDHLPGGHILYERGYSSLVSAITRHHGGFPRFRERLINYLDRTTNDSLLEEYLGSE